MNAFETSRPHLKEILDAVDQKDEAWINLKCKRIMIPIIKKKITLVTPLWWLVIKSNYRYIITTDYMHSSILKLICKIKGIKLSYYLESDGSNPKKYNKVRRLLNWFLLSGFAYYFYGFHGGDKLINDKKRMLLPCMDLKKIQEKHGKGRTNKWKDSENLGFYS